MKHLQDTPDILEYGAPEPDRSARYMDWQFDIWYWDESDESWTCYYDGYRMWKSHEWGDMRSRYFPMVRVA